MRKRRRGCVLTNTKNNVFVQALLLVVESMAKSMKQDVLQDLAVIFGRQMLGDAFMTWSQFTPSCEQSSYLATANSQAVAAAGAKL